MTIYGLSQTTGIERTLEVDATSAGIRLHSRDEDGSPDMDNIVVASEPLLAALMDRPAQRTTIPSVSAAGEASQSLDMTVRGNEVMLWVRPPKAATAGTSRSGSMTSRMPWKRSAPPADEFGSFGGQFVQPLPGPLELLLPHQLVPDLLRKIDRRDDGNYPRPAAGRERVLAQLRFRIQRMNFKRFLNALKAALSCSLVGSLGRDGVGSAMIYSSTLGGNCGGGLREANPNADGRLHRLFGWPKFDGRTTPHESTLFRSTATSLYLRVRRGPTRQDDVGDCPVAQLIASRDAGPGGDEADSAKVNPG